MFHSPKGPCFSLTARHGDTWSASLRKMSQAAVMRLCLSGIIYIMFDQDLCHQDMSGHNRHPNEKSMDNIRQLDGLELKRGVLTI